MSFKYCDPCATTLGLPELAARTKDTCENCGAENVECNHGDKKPAGKKKSKAKSKKPASKAKSKAKGKKKFGK